jgi:uncharacterized protein YjiS (DUF1127 family)
MPAIFATIVLPAVLQGPGTIARLLNRACEETAGFLGRRTTKACLHGLDDRALQDIGLTRFQIEAAVCGLIPLSAQADQGMTAFAAATGPHGRQRAPTMEAAPWS